MSFIILHSGHYKENIAYLSARCRIFTLTTTEAKWGWDNSGYFGPRFPILILTEMNTEWTRASFTNIWIYLHTYETRECRAWKKPLLSLCRLELNRCARNCVFRSSRSSSNFSKFESQLCCTCKSWLSFYNVIDILSYAASWFEMQNAKNAKWLLKYEP